MDPAESVNKRTLPSSRAAEMSLVGAMILDPEQIIRANEYVRGSDFYYRQYGEVFEILTELYNLGEAIDPVTIIEKMKEKELPPEICSPEFLSGAVREVPSSDNAPSYAKIIREKASLRKLIKICEGISNDCYEDVKEFEAIMESSEKQIFDLSQNRLQSDYMDIRDIILSVVDSIERASRNKGKVTGLATGFTDLDHKTLGFQKSDLIIIAARPSMGKTAFALNVAQYVVGRLNEAVAIFSLEMSKELLAQRLLAMESRLDSHALRSGELRDDEWDQLIEGASVIGNSKLIIDDTPAISVSALMSKARRYKLEKDIKLVMIDYLQLMTSGGRSESRQNEISEISRGLKALARDLEVPVVALSQLARTVEKRDDKRPMLSDLRESGAIEQDADVVMFLYRDEYYNPDTEDKNMAELIIGKQRNGPTGKIFLTWLPQYTKFQNMEYRS